MTSTPEGDGPDGAPDDETLFDDTAERTAMSSRRRVDASALAAPEVIASDSAAEGAVERTAMSSRRRATAGAAATASEAGEETATDGTLDSTIVVRRGTTRIDDETIRAARAPRATPVPRTASAPDRAAPASSRSASAPVAGRVAHAPVVRAEQYPRRVVPESALASGEDDAERRRPADAGIPPRPYGEGPAIDRAIRSTARRRAVILGVAILLVLASAAVALIVLLGGGAA